MRGLQTYLSLLRSRSGAALVEFAILIPFLFFGAFGVTEFARALYQFQIANKSAKAAARYVARMPGYRDSCPLTATEETALQTIASNIARTGTFSGTGDPYLQSWQDTEDDGVATVFLTDSCRANAPANLGEDSPLRGPDSILLLEVTVAFPFNDIGVLSMLNVNDIVISATHQEVYIGD